MKGRSLRTSQVARTPVSPRRTAGASGAGGATDLQGFQHAGNRLLGSFIQRDDAGGEQGETQQQGGEGQQRDWAADRQTMETVRADMQVRALKLDAFVGKALSDIHSLTESLGMVSHVYSECYERYAKAVEQAKVETKKNQEWADIGISIGIGVAIAFVPELAIFEAAPEATAAAKYGLKVAAGASEAVVHGVAETGLVKSGLTEFAGADLKTGGLTPEGQELETTKNLIALYQKVLNVGQQTGNLELAASGAEYAIGEIKAQIGGGAGADMQVPELVEMMEVLHTADTETASVDQQVEEATQYFDNLQKNALMTEIDRHKMEQDIVIMAMAEMSDAEAPELKAIKSYLDDLGVISAGHWSGSGGRLGVDFGLIYASSENTREAVAAARREKEKLKSEYDALAGGGGGGGSE